MLRAAANFHFLPVEHEQVGDGPGIDIPMFDYAWSTREVTTGMATVRVRTRRGRFWRSRYWDYYDIFYAIPNEPSFSNVGLRSVPGIPPFYGDIIVARRDVKGDRLLDIRNMDIHKVHCAVRL